uniref:Uncharacterized protein n=1 Tax=Schistosoma haematobium TaxID=6185 RepID=A0A094ZXG7_SCHHA
MNDTFHASQNQYAKVNSYLIHRVSVPAYRVLLGTPGFQIKKISKCISTDGNRRGCCDLIEI